MGDVLHRVLLKSRLISLQISSSPPLAVPKYPLLPAIEATPTASPPSRHSQGKKLSLGFFENDHSSNSGYYGYGHQASLGSDSDVTSSVDSLGVFMTQVSTNRLFIYLFTYCFVCFLFVVSCFYLID